MRRKALTWLLFAVWVVFNILDLMLSVSAVSAGASEVGLLYQLWGAWRGFIVSKMVLSLLVGLALVYYKKDRLLIALDIGIICVCIYGGWALLVS